jgi:hypothetical protein
MMAMRAMRDNGKTVVIVARQHTSARQPREAHPIVIAGLDPAIHPLTKMPLSLAKMMDPRVKPAGDGEGTRPISFCHCRA